METAVERLNASHFDSGRMKLDFEDASPTQYKQHHLQYFRLVYCSIL